MKRYVIGMLFGFALAISMSAYADDIKSLIGSKIQGEFAVKYEGVVLDKKAIVINGSSYLPVKAIAETLDLDATFNKTTGIELKKKEAGTSVTETVYTKKEYSIETQIRMLDDQIKETNGWINFYEKTISGEQQRGGRNVEGLNTWAIKLEEYKAQLVDLESQKAALEAGDKPTAQQ